MTASLKRAAAAGLGLVLLIAAALAGEDVMRDPLLTPDGRLQGDIELRDDQAGFAGTTTRLWRVDRDGTVRYEHLLNGNPIEPGRTATLDREKLADLAGVLSDQDFIHLPTEFGEGPKVNARTISIRFGDTESTLLLMPGQDPPAPAQASGRQDDLGRFAAIFHVLLATLEDPD